jgi:ABC-2 type transport system ATP-binding protein
VETYSTGMQQRLHLARCLLPDPQVLFLDEPTIGIDPVGSRQLRRIVKDLLGLGKTVLLTTHYMYEAEELCDRIAIINHGRIVAQDTPAGLKRAAGADTLIDIQAREAPAALLEQLARMGLAVEVQPAHTGSGTRVLVRTPDPGCAVETLAPFLKDERIQGWEVRRPSLEDVYVSIIQEEEHV